jgi:hypothetical protein
MEVFNEDFCEISTNTTSKISRFSPEEEDPLLLWKEMNSNSIVYEPISIQKEPENIVAEERVEACSRIDILEQNQTSKKYTESFFVTKLSERLELDEVLTMTGGQEVKEQESQYARWNARSRWWIDRPDEFFISLQQNELSQYIPDLFSPSGTLLDREYSLVRCSTRLDQAVQELNEKYDMSQHIEFESIEKDDDLDVEDELDLFLSELLSHLIHVIKGNKNASDDKSGHASSIFISVYRIGFISITPSTPLTEPEEI